MQDFFFKLLNMRRSLLFFSIIFIFIVFMVLLQTLGIYYSDTPEHIQVIQLFFDGEIFMPHPLWHILVKFVSTIFFIPINISASIVSALFVLVWSLIVYNLANKAIKTKNEQKIIYITFIIITIGPLWAPWFNFYIYLGQGSPNVWHNVTYWTVKPLALLSIIYTLNALNKKQLSKYIWAIFFILLSIVAKPSFIIVYIPTLLFYILLKKDHSKNSILFFISIVTLSFFVLGLQYLNTFGSDSKVIIDFLGVWSLYTPNVGISILLGLAFPLMFTLFYTKSLHNNYIYFAWIQVLIAILFGVFFAEEGFRYEHGNFIWSYHIAVSILYLFIIIEFFKQYKFITQWKKRSLFGLLFLQEFVGLIYLLKILFGFGYA